MNPTLLAHSDLTVANLVATAVRYAGQPLTSVAGRSAFTVRVYDGIIAVTPDSSGVERRIPASDLIKFCDRYRRTGSTSPKDYTDDTYHSVYLIRLARLSHQ